MDTRVVEVAADKEEEEGVFQFQTSLLQITTDATNATRLVILSVNVLMEMVSTVIVVEAEVVDMDMEATASASNATGLDILPANVERNRIGATSVKNMDILRGTVARMTIPATIVIKLVILSRIVPMQELNPATSVEE